MDVYLKKHYESIPNLVEVVKNYARNEQGTLLKATWIRTNVQDGDLFHTIDGEMKIGDALKSLFVMAETYPDLKANTNFPDLQERMMKMEEEIAFSRRYYNGSVRGYNNLCQMFPFNFVVGMLGYKTLPIYAVENETERKAVDVEL